MKDLTIKQHTAIHTGFCIAGVVLAAISYFFNRPLEPHFTLWIALACLAVGLIWRILFIKCPYCGDGLYGSRVIPKFCPNCGKELNPPTEGDSL